MSENVHWCRKPLSDLHASLYNKFLIGKNVLFSLFNLEMGIIIVISVFLGGGNACARLNCKVTIAGDPHSCAVPGLCTQVLDSKISHRGKQVTILSSKNLIFLDLLTIRPGGSPAVGGRELPGLILISKPC